MRTYRDKKVVGVFGAFHCAYMRRWLRSRAVLVLRPAATFGAGAGLPAANPLNGPAAALIIAGNSKRLY
jgi:hypothetical protein